MIQYELWAKGQFGTDNIHVAHSEILHNTAYERRRHYRKPVLQRAQLVFDDGTIDCALLDISDTGARVRTMKQVHIPEWVRLDLPDGTSFRANRRWCRGLEIGFRLNSLENDDLLTAMIDGLTRDQKRSLLARIEASLAQDTAPAVSVDASP